MDQELFEQVDTYIGNLLGDEDEALKNAIKAIDKAGIPQISVTANQGKFLQVLARLVNAKKILEVGTLGGYSTIWMARALPAEGKLITLEIDKAHADVALENFKNARVENKIELRLGPALETLPALLDENAGPFDMIFIDADKPPYPEYFEWALKLSRPGTLIIADNVIREGKVLDENHTDDKVQGVHRLNKMLSGNKKVTATIIQTVGAKEHDGMAIAVVN
jgi:predicted O-methyltransferase YrrM